MGPKLRTTLIYAFKALNFVLAVIGAMMCLYSFWLFHEYAANESSTTLTRGLGGDEISKSTALLSDLNRATGHKRNSNLTWDVSVQLPDTWYIYTFTFVGVFLLVTAIFGSVISEFPSRSVFTIYIGLYAILIISEIIVWLLVKIIGTSNLPTDGSGQLAVALEVFTEFPTVSWFGIISVFFVQIAASVVAYGLRYFETHFISVVREDDFTLQAPLLPPHPEFSPVPVNY